MSDSDSFISEVNDEVRRERLYLMLRRYGWIAGLAVLLIVGGAAWTEYRKAQVRGEAESFGDAVLAAMSEQDAAVRADKLAEVRAGADGARAVVDLLIASEAQLAGNRDAAIAALENVSLNGELPEIYRQIAGFKLLILQAGSLDVDARRQQFEALAQPGQPLALLAQEQLALIDIAAGDTEAAIARLHAIVRDAGVSSDLQQRALQVIVSLGGTPDMADLPTTGN